MINLNKLIFKVHIDLPLFLGVICLMVVGLMTLYSAADENMSLVIRQLTHFAIGLTGMLFVAQIPMRIWIRWIPWFYALGIILLAAVMWFGITGKGAQRWLDLKFIRFQPSEIMKLAVPMMVAWYLNDRHIPPTLRSIAVCLAIIFIPVAMIARQPDLGTSILIACAGGFVVFLAGLGWRLIGIAGILCLASVPLLWYVMKDYQKQRVLTLFDPEKDPLGAGYHIIQSMIALGSGGLYGKGWLNGTQSQLGFLPERKTDFIFAVFCEEFGFLGVLVLLTLYSFVIMRGLFMATNSQGTFARLVSGSLSLTFFIYIFVNIGMVSGQLPVVGIPLPLVSYGGTSLVTMMLGFGFIMSAYTHRQLMYR